MASPLVVDKIEVPTEEVTGETCLNRKGGQILTINGSGFNANDFKLNEVRIGNDKGKVCDITSVTPTAITCETRKA